MLSAWVLGASVTFSHGTGTYELNFSQFFQPFYKDLNLVRKIISLYSLYQCWRLLFFGPPGSGSVSKRYGSFNHQAKIVSKPLWLFIFEKWCQCTPSISKNPSWRSLTKIARSGSGFIVTGEDPRIRIRTKNVTDPQHCLIRYLQKVNQTRSQKLDEI